MLLVFSLHLVGLVRGERVDAATWPLFVVEIHCLAHGVGHLLDACKSLSVQQFIVGQADGRPLDGVCDALGHGIVFRVTVLGNAGDDMAAFQHLDVVGAGSETLCLGEMQLAEGAEVENSIEETADSEPLAADGFGAAAGAANTTGTVVTAPPE